GVGAVNINTATGEELDRLPGIGPKIASRIVEHRKSRPFREAKDLMNVDGIGEKKYDALKDRITVH
ncbi:MAG TPA: ComEA family DNA-binding protein, partial [bacterium]|nr:ComEA family DNA-binding protein [bacterium]